MQDDMADLLEQAEEIQNAMGRSYNTDDIDEADLEAELAARVAARAGAKERLQQRLHTLIVQEAAECARTARMDTDG